MKLSRCVIFVQEFSEEYIAACTLTRAIIRLNKRAKQDLEQGDPDNLLELTEKQFNDCIEMGFLVPDNLDERNYLSYILNKDRLCPIALATFVAFSTLCNFGCVYCYEKGQVEYQTMEDKTVDSLLQWYQRKLGQGHFSICSVDLYGGEPLLFTEMISGFLFRLKEITDELNIKLEIRLVTNGYLLTQNIVNKLLPFGLGEVHVTIDGDRDYHNRRRPLKSIGQDGTFDVVFNNLVNISTMNLPNDFDIVCRVGFDKSNIEGIPGLLDKIKERDKTGKIYPYFGSTTQTTSQVAISESFCSRNVLCDESIADNLIFLYQEARKRGLPIPDFFTLGPCMVLADSAGVISPDGLIYKCLDMMGHKNLSIGDIKLSEFGPVYYDFIKADKLDQCLNTDCPFVPICGGGCAMEAYLATGDYKKAVCHRKMLEKIYSNLLPLKFSD